VRGVFQGLRWRLLLYQLSIMGTIMGIFGLGVYGLFSRNLHRQLDQKLMTLAQAATPSMTEVSIQGEDYLDELDEVPWRDIFNRNQQSLEWFDTDGNLLAKRGDIELTPRPKVGVQTMANPPVRAFTVSVFEDEPNADSPYLTGYIRASQTTQSIQAAQRQLLIGLAMGGGITLLLVGAGGLWLTQIALRPVEYSYHQLMQFTADASHELRGPLMAIKASIGVMQKHPERFAPKDTKKLNAIGSATIQLQSLAEDLLLLARMDAERTTQAPEKVSINRCLRDVVALYGEAAKAKELDLKLQEAQQVLVWGQAAQLNRLFSNLVQNALHYTQTGQIVVTLDRSRRYARIRVEDSGIGIAPKDLPHVFDRFWRADRARSRRAGGSGLGLAIAKAITIQYGGKIWVTSQPGQGSCFHVVLPLADAVRLPEIATMPWEVPS
jgi:OmpR-family two-component system manganese-sensing sensor histidine kinase